MPTKKEIAEMFPAQRERYEEEREERASRKRFRTKWRTGVTEKDKTAALKLALNRLPGGKKYAWLQQGQASVSPLLEPFSTSFKLATAILLPWELYPCSFETTPGVVIIFTKLLPSFPRVVPMDLSTLSTAPIERKSAAQTVSMQLEEHAKQLNDAEIDMLEAELEKELMDSETPGGGIQVTTETEKPAASANERSNSGSELQPPATVEEGSDPTKGRGKKRALGDECEGDGGARKKQKSKERRTPKSARMAQVNGPASPAYSSSPEPRDSSRANTTDPTGSGMVAPEAPLSPAASVPTSPCRQSDEDFFLS
ncbi:hypothetical protein HD806DRAFT_547149 [Xylariaceae sp. AK1471]|nr:hypothetical protein HD806DRAFT_547149 [Xylariaceae sp. AK1471]